MHNYSINVQPVLLGAPLQLMAEARGPALSARFVRLLVNPALRVTQRLLCAGRRKRGALPISPMVSIMFRPFLLVMRCNCNELQLAIQTCEHRNQHQQQQQKKLLHLFYCSQDSINTQHTHNVRRWALYNNDAINVN